MDHCIECQNRTLMAFGCRTFERPAIVGEAGKAKQAALAVEQGVEFIDRELILSGNVEYRAGIDIAGTCAHDEAFKRCETHRRIDAFAVQDCGCRRTVAEMGNHEAMIAGVKAQQFHGFLRDKAVAGAVEAVTADAGITIGLRNGIGMRGLRDGHVEGRVEHRHMRYPAEHFHGDTHAKHVCGVMQRSEIGEGLDLVENFGIEADCLGKTLAAMHDPVSDSTDRVQQIAFLEAVHQSAQRCVMAAAIKSDRHFRIVFFQDQPAFRLAEIFGEA
ncbi:hypothetical protein D3C80_1125900 [compost metagenome]